MNFAKQNDTMSCWNYRNLLQDSSEILFGMFTLFEIISCYGNCQDAKMYLTLLLMPFLSCLFIKSNREIYTANSL